MSIDKNEVYLDIDVNRSFIDETNSSNESLDEHAPLLVPKSTPINNRKNKVKKILLVTIQRLNLLIIKENTKSDS